MLTRNKCIAVVGGGLSGMLSVVNLETEGLEPVCFEARDAPGGTWYYSDQPTVGYAGTMPTTVLNNSKEISAFSIFPPRKECNIYMQQSEAYKYYMEFYEHFRIGRYMKFNTEVIRVRRAEDYSETGRFLVTVRDKVSGEVSTDVYDGVSVCTGHFCVPAIPEYPGLDKFKGTVIHSHSLKGVEKFKGQNVLVIGNGCSGLDAVDATSEVAKQVYLSSRSGMFVISRQGPGGYPIDYILFRRYLNILFECLPRKLISWYLETFYMDTKFDHRLYSVEPKQHMMAKDPILNDVLFSKLLSGSVILHGAVKFFTETGVVFEGEDEHVVEIDAVIMATGYTLQIPFLEEGLLEIEDGMIKLYKCMYPTQLPHLSLVFLGLFNPFGPGVPALELQVRWSARMFSGKGKLPSREVMMEDVLKRHNENKSWYTSSEYNSVRVDYMGYQDDIASILGVKPNLVKYLFTDFPLFLRLMFGPFLPYQFRLQGPQKWDGAREAIMTCSERLFWPLNKGKRRKKPVVEMITDFIGNLVPRNILLH